MMSALGNSHPRGLSLVEALAAAALLAVTATVCVRMLDDAAFSRRGHEAPRDGSPLELETAIERYLADWRARHASSEGLGPASAPPGPVRTHLVTEDGQPIVITSLTHTSTECDHAWVVAIAGDRLVLRWEPLPPRDAETVTP